MENGFVMFKTAPVLRIIQAASLLLVLSLAACGGADPSPGISNGKATDLALVLAVMQTTEQGYVHPVTDETLTKNALKGMLNRLDPHSDYMDASEYAMLKSENAGEFGGLGIELSDDNGIPRVVSPIDGTPAAKAGIEPGDVILRIDGKPTEGMAFSKIIDTLRGAVGSAVTITIARKGRSPFDVKIVRDTIRVDTVKYSLEPGKIGYIRISEFADNTEGQVQKAVTALDGQAGGKLSGLVLDLRNDPGGLLSAAVSVSGNFLDGGTIVTLRGRDAQHERVFAAPSKGDILPGTPVVVLINGGSASASEIVAGALQDRHRATLMGEPSFGKGSVQSIIPVGDGAIRLTTALYYTPSGRSIQGNGITPDLVVSVPPDAQSPNPVIREADLSGALANSGSLSGTTAAAPGAAPADMHPIRLSLIGTKQDAQLAAALKYLSSGGQAGMVN
jgi:carboxyl-terminal processing protease